MKSLLLLTSYHECESDGPITYILLITQTDLIFMMLNIIKIIYIVRTDYQTI